jgi:sugar phosphate isomerase/epimerase
MQAFEVSRERIAARFRREWAGGERLPPLRLSWSNWSFGQEPLHVSLARLAANGIEYIELHGNRYGADLGYDAAAVRDLLASRNMRVSGVCGIFSDDNDLSSNRGHVRQRAIDYIRRNLELGHDVGAEYMLVVPGAVGRPRPIDPYERDRSVETLRLVADDFTQAGVKGAVEPIRSAEVSFCHTLADAAAYIEAVGHPGVQHINADLYHMVSEESNPYEALVAYGDQIINLHLADTNRRALGAGILDVDLVIQALHCTHYARRGYCTGEPLGPGGDPYPALYGHPPASELDALVSDTAQTLRARELAVAASLGM